MISLACALVLLSCLVGCARGGGDNGPLPQGSFDGGELGFECPEDGINLASLSRSEGFTLAELGSLKLEKAGRQVSVFDTNGDGEADGVEVGDTTIRLCVPNNTVSFVVQADDRTILPSSDDARSLVTSFVVPDGTELIPSVSGLDYLFSEARPTFGGTQKLSSVAYPKSPTVTSAGGIYDVRISAVSSSNQDDVPGSSVDVSIAIRRGEAQGRSLLGMRVIVAEGSDLSTSDINHLRSNLLGELNSIYAQTNLQIDPERFEIGFIRDPSYGVVRATREDLGELTSASVVDEGGNAMPEAADGSMIHLFITSQVVDPSDNSTIFALASGIPGALGFPASAGSGVFLSAAAVRNSVGSFVSETLHLAIAHEVGHWLGLHHTTEWFGGASDPIEDTPNCPPEFDTGGGAGGQPNGRVEGTECIDRDGTNLMFWNALDTRISEQQGVLLGWSPILTPLEGISQQ